jgi:hypothetical protein
MVKQAILTVTPRFSARRMLKEYAETAYLPAFKKRPGLPTEARSAKAGTTGSEAWTDGAAHRSAVREGGK